jgi:iron(III) transport system permease protein
MTVTNPKLASLRLALQSTWTRRLTHHPPFFLWLTALPVTALVLLPLGYLVIRAAGAGYDKTLNILLRPRTHEILMNSVALAVSVTLLSIVIGVSLAWLTSRTDLPGRKFWAIAAILPLVIPSYVGAFTLISAFGPRGLAQGWLEPLGVERLPSIYGFPGAFLALTLFTYPYILLSVRAALRGLDPSLEEVARSLGRTPLQVFREITLPHLRPAIVAGALLVALYTLSDFGAVSMFRFDTFTRAIYMQYTASFDRSVAAVLALLLVALTLLILIFEHRARGKARYYRSSAGTVRPTPLITLGKWRWPALAFCGLMTLLGLLTPWYDSFVSVSD